MAAEIPHEHLRAWQALLAVQASITAEVEDALAAVGLPALAWYDALWPLHRAGRPLRMGELAAEVRTIGRTGLTRLVDRLEGAGLLRRAPAANDRRGVEVSITPDGSRLLRRMWPVYAEVLRTRFVDPMGGPEARRLARTLTDLAGRPIPDAGGPRVSG